MASHLSLVDLMLWCMPDGSVPMRFEVMVYGLDIILFPAICISRMLFVFRECVAPVFLLYTASSLSLPDGFVPMDTSGS